MPKKLQEIFPTVAMLSLRETRCFAKCFRHYSALSNKRRGKLFKETVYKKDKEKKKSIAFPWDFKNA